MRVVMIIPNFGYEIKTNDDNNIQTKHNKLKTEQISQSSRSTLTIVSHGNVIAPHMLQLYTTGLGTSKTICLKDYRRKQNTPVMTRALLDAY